MGIPGPVSVGIPDPVCVGALGPVGDNILVLTFLPSCG